jgi:hypothetical protein
MSELVDFDEAHVDYDSSPPLIVVSGVVPIPMRVELKPDDREYVVQPEYTQTEVLGLHEEESEQVETPYKVEVPVTELNLGTKGTEIVGKSRTKTLDIRQGS